MHRMPIAVTCAHPHFGGFWLCSCPPFPSMNKPEVGQMVLERFVGLIAQGGAWVGMMGKTAIILRSLTVTLKAHH